MAERLDGVLSELLAAQNNAPATDTAPNTEPATAGGDNTGVIPEKTDESTPVTTEETPVTPEQTEVPVGEVPTAPTPNARDAELARSEAMLQAQNEEIGRLRDAIQQMQELQRQMQAAQSEASRANEEAVAKAVLEPPTIDLNEVQYMDDAQRSRALAAYSAAMADYTKQSMMSELSPIVEQYRKQTKEAEDAAVRGQIANSGKFAGFSEDADKIEKIVRVTPGLSELPPEQKYVIGYMIHRGAQAMNAKPAAPETVEELVQRVMANPEAMKVLEKQRVAKAAAANKGAPPIAASQGQSSSPAVAPAPPQSLDEARARALKMLGLNT